MTNHHWVYNRWLWAAVAFVLVSAFFQFIIPNVADIDSFFYIRLASIYNDTGLLNTAFPWIQASVIKGLGSSLWYGFGVLLIPFTIFQDPALGIKIAGLLLTAGALFSFYLVLRKLAVKNPLFWTFFMFFAGPNSMNHLLRTRPQTLSLALLPLFFYFVLKKNFWGTLIIAFCVAWGHLNFAWLPVLVFIAIAMARLAVEKSFNWKGGLATVGGVLLGWLARPNFWLAAKLFYVQVAKQILEKQGGLPLLFGSENLPFAIPMLLEIFFLFLLVLTVAAVFFFRSLRQIGADDKIIVFSSIGLALVFLLMAVLVARRAHDLMVIFGTLGTAAIFNRLKDSTRWFPALVFAAAVLYSGYRTINNLSKKYPPDYLKEPAVWLKENSNAGDVVFNLHWSNFSPLFAWNQKNYYVGGLDPIFQYDYSQNLYWKFHYLSLDEVTKKTCGAIACTREMLEDTYGVLKNDFHAKYVMLTKNDNPAVNQFMSGDPRFEKKFDNGSEIVYLIK